MFQENRLIYRQLNKGITDAFDKAIERKIDAEDAIEDFHQHKDNPEKAQQQIDISKISLSLQDQLNSSLDDPKLFIDKTRAKKLLDELNKKHLDKRTLKLIEAEIKTRQNNVQAFVSQLNQEHNLEDFTKSSLGKPAAKKEFLDNFISLTPEEQEKRITDIKAHIQKLNDQLANLLKIIDPHNQQEVSEFKKLSLENQQIYLKESQTIQTEYKKLLEENKISDKEQKNKLKLLSEKGLQGKKQLLKLLQETLKPKSEDLEFKQAKTNRQKKYPDFQILSSKEKTKALETIREEIKTEYLNKFRKHKYFHTASKVDIKTMESTFSENNGKFNIEMAEACLDWLDSTMEQMNKLHEETKDYSSDVLKHFNWNNLGFFEKKGLHEKGKLKNYSEKIEHLDLDKAYEEKLEKYLQKKPIGLINEKGFESYYKWFQKLDLEQKHKIVEDADKNPTLDYLELTKAKREKTNARFLKLPKAIQAEYHDEYLESDFEERQRLILKLKESEKELNQEFSDKLDEVIEEKLLSEKSRKRYENWFKKDLNLEQKREYLDDSNLDRQERKQILQEFEEEILPILPDKQQKSIAKKFYDLDLNRRRKYLIQLKNKYKNENKELNEAKIQANKEEKSAEEKNQSIDQKGIVHKYFIQAGEKLEKTGDKEGALKFYKEALEIDLELSPKQKEDLENKITKLEEEQNLALDDKNQETENQFTQTIQMEVDNIINADENLRQELDRLTVLEYVHTIQKNNERYYDTNYTDTAGVMDESLEESYEQEANQAFIEYTEGQYSFYGDQYEDTEIGQTDELLFDLQEFDTLQEFHKWKAYIAEIQRMPKEAQFDPRLKITDPKTGRLFDAKKFKTQILLPNQTEFKENITSKVINKLKVNSDSQLATMISNVITNKQFKSDLPKSKQNLMAA